MEMHFCFYNLLLIGFRNKQNSVSTTQMYHQGLTMYLEVIGIFMSFGGGQASESFISSFIGSFIM